MNKNLFLEVKKFIKDNFIMGSNEIGNDDSLIGNGIVDSLGIVEIITFVEENYNVVVYDDEVGPNNFDSINKIVAFIETKKK